MQAYLARCSSISPSSVQEAARKVAAAEAQAIKRIEMRATQAISRTAGGAAQAAELIQKGFRKTLMRRRAANALANFRAAPPTPSPLVHSAALLPLLLRCLRSAAHGVRA